MAQLYYFKKLDRKYNKAMLSTDQIFSQYNFWLLSEKNCILHHTAGVNTQAGALFLTPALSLRELRAIYYFL